MKVELLRAVLGVRGAERIVTCIVGLKRGADVWIGGDSLSHNNETASLVRDGKVFVRDGMAFGVTGSWRLKQLLQHAIGFSAVPAPEALDAWLVQDFVDALRKGLEQGGMQKKKDEVESAADCSGFLLGVSGRLFHVWSDFQVEESLDDYNAAGSGDECALGALYVLSRREHLEPEKVLGLALEAAAEHTPHVRAPFHFVKAP